MGPGWTHVVRFAPGTRLRFAQALTPALRAAVLQGVPELREWLARLDSFTVLSVEHDRCALRARAGADAAPLGDVTAEPDPQGGYRVRVQLTLPSESQVHDFDGVALMLGGARDAFLAQRNDAGTRQLLRLHYDPDGSVSVLIFPAAFATQLPAIVRALLPTELSIGTLRPIGNSSGA